MTPIFQNADITVTPIIEGVDAFSAATEFLPNLTAERLAENRAWLHPWALNAQDWLVLAFQSFLVKTAHHTILVDTCVGNDKDRETRPAWHRKNDDTWLAALNATGTRVENVDFVLCTHLHVDHVGWNTRLENGRWVPTFPNARYLFSAKELEYWTARNADAPVPCIVDSVLPIVAANRADLVTSDHALNELVRLLPTPGHTPDHFAVELGRGGTPAVITGDLLHSPLQLRYPDLQFRADLDPARAVETRKGFLEKFCDTGTVCCFTHFPAPSASRVRRWGEGFRCETMPASG